MGGFKIYIFLDDLFTGQEAMIKCTEHFSVSNLGFEHELLDFPSQNLQVSMDRSPKHPIVLQ